MDEGSKPFEDDIFKEIVMSSGFGIFVAEKNRIHLANPKFIEIFGYDPCDNQIYSKDIQNLFLEAREVFCEQPPDAPDIPTSSVRDVTCRKKDGTFFDAEIFVKEIRYKGRSLIRGSVRDTTLEKRIRSHLVEAENVYKTLVETASNSGLGIFVLQDRGDKEGVYQFANEEYCRITGYSVDELLGRTFKETTHPDFLDETTERYRKRKRGLVPAGLHEIDVMTRDGRRIPIHYSIGLTNYNGRLACIGYSRDISDEKRLKSQLFMSEKLASMGRLVASIAHEIDNPLASLSSFAQILLDRKLDDSTRDCVQSMYEIIQRIASVVRQLSMMSRPQIGILSEVDVNSLVRTAIESIRLDRRNAGIDIDLKLDERCPKVMADENQLLQVLVNIMINGVDAMPKGGNLAVWTSRVPGRAIANPCALIAIKDTGEGIKDEVKTSVFDPFFTTKGIGEGTGLGLYVSYEIVKKLNGQIEFESEDGKGTTFFVKLTGIAE
jgi:PAS domain S-box-containing protein